MTARLTRPAIWLRIFCAALLLSLGLGHSPLYAATATNPASNLYVLPDGSFAGLCFGGGDQGKRDKSSPGIGCDICRLAGNVLLPDPPAGHAPVSGSLLAVTFPSRADLIDAGLPRPGSPVRGPPSVFA